MEEILAKNAGCVSFKKHVSKCLGIWQCELFQVLPTSTRKMAERYKAGSFDYSFYNH